MINLLLISVAAITSNYWHSELMYYYPKKLKKKKKRFSSINLFDLNNKATSFKTPLTLPFSSFHRDLFMMYRYNRNYNVATIKNATNEGKSAMKHILTWYHTCNSEIYRRLHRKKSF